MFQFDNQMIFVIFLFCDFSVYLLKFHVLYERSTDKSATAIIFWQSLKVTEKTNLFVFENVDKMFLMSQGVQLRQNLLKAIFLCWIWLKIWEQAWN